ncbi:MAG: MTH1187 family thiamine-binding protein [Deltaproteobacteria bacterium]|nr:MTH1187 family thiamine-binding protein [Deltaproteobacteria bacterium]
MIAEFRITPFDCKESFPKLVAEVLRVVSESNLQYQLHAMGTTLEGELDEILYVVQRSHEVLRKHSDRLLIELSVDDRFGREGELIRSIEHVRELDTGIPLERLTATGEY